MKTFIADIFPKIQRFSQKLDDITLLTNQHWVNIDNIIQSKTVYIFRQNCELLISTNGQVRRARWEYLGNKTLLIDIESKSYLFKHGFFDQNIFALKLDSSEEYAVFVNENKFSGELNSIDKVIDFLKEKYLSLRYSTQTENSMGYDFESLPSSINVDSIETEQRRKNEYNKRVRNENAIIIPFLIILALIFIYYVSHHHNF